MNKGWVDINKASRFYQSSRVMSLGAMSPLKLIDVATGVDVSSDGSPMTGQLLLTIDSQQGFIVSTGNQLNLAQTGSTVAIYQNTTGRQVFISSILLSVTFQQNQSGLTPTVTSSARVTAGTQAGNYRDIIGTIDPSQAQQQGALACLYATNQMKELFPDAGQSYFLLDPGQIVYLRTDTPAGTPIVAQFAVARVKGHVL